MNQRLVHKVVQLASWLQRGLRYTFITPRINPDILQTSNALPGPQLTSTGNWLDSRICRVSDLESSEFRYWCQQLGIPFRLHRKVWEWCYICLALSQRGLLQPGRRGLGFAVGREPLTATFAKLGCRITASDLAADDERIRSWAPTGQWADSLSALNAGGICPDDVFRSQVEFRSVDMNDIPSDLCRGEYDFTWSSCSFEHCGSIRLGLDFLKRQMECLRPGGVAVHTTEFNLSSNTTTITWGPSVIFRKSDLESLIAALTSAGHHVEPLNLQLGTHPLDTKIDFKPYSNEHLRLAASGYAVTSIGLIVRRGQ